MRKAITILASLWLGAGLIYATPVSLEQARSLALSNDKDYQASQMEADAARQTKKSALTKLLPSVSFSGGYVYKSDLIHYDSGLLQLPIYDFSTGQPVQNPTQYAFIRIDEDLGQHDNVQLGLTARQYLFTGGKLWNNYRLNAHLAEVSTSKAELKRQDVLLGVEKSYCQVAELSAKASLAESYRQTIVRHLEELGNYLQAGVITNNEVLKAKVKLSEADLNLIKARDGLTLATMDLNRRLGLNVDDPTTLTDGLEAVILQPIVVDTAAVLSIRPELKALDNAVAANDALVNIKWADYMPSVVLEGATIWTRPNPYNSFLNEYGQNWQISLLCQWELLDFNRRGYELAAAKHQREAARLRYSDTQEQITLQVKQEGFRCTEAAQQVALARDNVQQADENLRETNDLFSQGLVKSTDVLDAQTLWEQAHSNLIDAMANLRVQNVTYKKALGRL